VFIDSCSRYIGIFAHKNGRVKELRFVRYALKRETWYGRAVSVPPQYKDGGQSTKSKTYALPKSLNQIN